MTSVSLRSARLHEREGRDVSQGMVRWRGIRDEYEGTEPYMRRGRRVVTTEEQTPMTRIISGI